MMIKRNDSDSNCENSTNAVWTGVEKKKQRKNKILGFDVNKIKR